MGWWQMWLTGSSWLALILLGLGVPFVLWRNWQAWQADKVVLQAEPAAVPVYDRWPRQPLVSFLVGAWQEVGGIEAHIASIMNLRYPHKELVLVAGGLDGTYEAACACAATYEGVTVLEQLAGEGKQNALRRGLPESKGSIIFLTDADCRWQDADFEQTLYPLIIEEEQVATGASRPYPELLNNWFVVSQGASDLRFNSNPDAARYFNGILGRNCAVERTLLEASKALDIPVKSGTDYVLAKSLIGQGARIRQVYASQVMTEYPQTVGHYIRQRRRWLRNNLLHGIHYKEWQDVRASLISSTLGVVMLGLPLLGLLLGPLPVAVWAVLLLHGYVSRVRYLWFMAAKLGRTFGWQQYGAQFAGLYIDFITWSWAIGDYLSRRRREEW